MGISPIEVDFEIDEATGCWNCTSHKPDSKGYPRIFRGTYSYRVARYVWKTYVDECTDLAMEGYEIHHVCKNPACINPDHLEKLSKRDHRCLDKKRLRKIGSLGGRASRKLFDKQVVEIFLARGSQEKIAKVYKVSQANVSAIKRRHTYQYLTEGL